MVDALENYGRTLFSIYEPLYELQNHTGSANAGGAPPPYGSTAFAEPVGFCNAPHTWATDMANALFFTYWS